MEKTRCPWCLGSDIYQKYHDEEWGVPVHDDRKWFEFITLEGAQAGLSWITILKRREGYRKAFANFDPEEVAKFDSKKIEELMQFENIIRNRRKIESAIGNAKAFLKIQQDFGSFDNYIWDFVDGKPIVNHFASMAEIPAQTELSVLISKDLKKRGFTFMGPTIVYAHMQATGMVNDHLTNCPRHAELKNFRSDK
jgi:DNA-3-methyladenine glycosylase I